MFSKHVPNVSQTWPNICIFLQNVPNMSQTYHPNLPNMIKTIFFVQLRLSVKDSSIFDLNNGFYAKTTTPIGDIQTPGIEDIGS